jgi:serine protease
VLQFALATVVACVLALLLLSRTPEGYHGTAPEGAEVVAGELIVRFDTDVTPEQRQALLEAAGASLQREMSLPGYVVLDVPMGQEVDTARTLAQSPVIASIDRETLRQPAGAPNDPAYPQQWHLPEVGLEAASEMSDGSGVIVAIVDTGVAYENYVNPETNDIFAPAPDLNSGSITDPCDVTAGIACWCETTSAACVCPGGIAPCANTIRNPHANDDYGHGTHIAGTVAQVTNNGVGGAGLAPAAHIMPVKACHYTLRAAPPNHPAKSVYGCKPQDLADAIVYAVKQGADIINLSITSPPSSINPIGSITQAERDALALAEDAGVPVFAASGNDDLNKLTYPSAVPSVVAVGAIGMNEVRAGYSNYGPDEDGGLLDIVAPGGDPTREGAASHVFQQSYAACTRATSFVTFPPVTQCHGTSMAAAHASGVAALVLSRFPDLPLDDLRDLLRCSAKDLGDPGIDQRYGSGLIRADIALLDLDADDIPDCIDPDVPTPSPFPTPVNNCLFPSTTPSLSPSPTPSPTPEPTIAESSTPDTVESPTPTSSVTPSPDPMATPPPSPSESPGEPTPSPEPTPAMDCGDVDCSGDVNPLDALGIIAWTATSLPIAQCIGLGFVTCDDVLDSADAISVLSYSGGITQTIGCPTPQ